VILTDVWHVSSIKEREDLFKKQREATTEAGRVDDGSISHVAFRHPGPLNLPEAARFRLNLGSSMVRQHRLREVFARIAPSRRAQPQREPTPSPLSLTASRSRVPQSTAIIFSAIVQWIVNHLARQTKVSQAPRTLVIIVGRVPALAPTWALSQSPHPLQQAALVLPCWWIVAITAVVLEPLLGMNWHLRVIDSL